MEAFKASSKALDARVCRGTGGEDDASNKNFDGLRDLYDRTCSTVANAATDAATRVAAPVAPPQRPQRPASPAQSLFDVESVMANLEADGPTLFDVTPPPPLAEGEADNMETEGNQGGAAPANASAPAPASGTPPPAGRVLGDPSPGPSPLEKGQPMEEMKNALDTEAAAPSPSPVRPPMPPLKKTKKDIKYYFNKK